MRTGSYGYDYGYSSYRNIEGYWWSGDSSSTTDSRFLYTYSTNAILRSNGSRGAGFAIRCTIRVE